MVARRYGSVQSVGKGLAGVKAEYDAAKSSRFKRRLRGVNLAGSGADYHVRSEADYLRIIEWAREVERNDMVVGQGIDRLVTNVLGMDGFKLDPTSGRTEFDAAVKQRFADWADDPMQCDVSREHAFNKQVELAYRAQIRDGDYLFAGRRDGTLQSFEAHRLRTPKGTQRNVIHGVLLDEFRRRLQYWVTIDDIDPMRSLRLVRETQPVEAFDEEGFRTAFHIYHPRRVSQTRGISALAPVGDPISFHGDIQFAKLVQTQMASTYAIIHNNSDDFQAAQGDTQHGERTTETLADGSTRTVEGIAPGMEYFASPGEELTGFSPRIPNPEWFDHCKLILTLIALNLGLPLVVFLMDASETNFSGYRGALSQAREGFRRIQQALIRQLHTPVYSWKLRQFLAEDEGLRKLGAVELARDGSLVFTDPAVLRHRFQPPRWKYIEPLKDAQADALQQKERLSSPRRIHAEKGADYEEVAGEIVEDRALVVELAIRRAETFNQQHPDARVDWRELAGFDPKGRTPDAQARRMEDLARAVRAGVPIAESEARVALGLTPEPVEGETTLRFNDQDILQYHIEDSIVTRNEARSRLKLPAVVGGDAFVRRVGVNPVTVGSPEGDTEEDTEGENEGASAVGDNGSRMS